MDGRGEMKINREPPRYAWQATQVLGEFLAQLKEKSLHHQTLQ